MKSITYAILMIIFLMFSCRISQEIIIEEKTEQTERPVIVSKKKEIEKDLIGLKDVYKDDFLIGAAIEPAVFKREAHTQLLLKHFSSITAENSMKPSSIHPEEERYNFTAADQIVEFAQEHNISVRGHTLIWHSQVPDWFFVENGKPASRETLRKRLKAHITEIMQRYKGKIDSWDVVNEPVDQSKEDGLRRNQWYEILGEEYIELAFRYAREADPDATLILNEFNNYDFAKRAKIIQIIKRLKAKGVPVDGVGMQMHINLSKPFLYEIEKALKEYAGLGLEIQITELDVSVYENRREESLTTISKDILNEQGHRLKDIFSLFKKYSKNITNVTFWGLADDNTWLKYHFVKREDWPLPFDIYLKAKPFYWGMVDPSKLSTRINRTKAVEGNPKIDGKEDKRWQFTEFFPNFPFNTDFNVAAKALWDKRYLYLLLNVTDQTPARNDAISLFIDEKSNRSETMDLNDKVIEFVLDDNFKNSDDAATTKTKSGYVFETRVPFEFIEGAKDVVLGLDILVKNGEDTLIKWNDQENISGTIPKYWGIVKLVQPPKSAVANYGNPVLDGKKDDLYDKGESIPVALFIHGIEGEGLQFSGATGKAWVVWNEKALGVYIEVSDAVLSAANDLEYMQDSIEIFMDENNSKSSSYENDDGQYRVNLNNAVSFGSTGGVKGFKSATRIISGGYAVEVILPYRSITAEEGTIIGFDLQINDDGGSGKRDSITKWNDPTNDSWQSTARFGVLIFEK